MSAGRLSLGLVGCGRIAEVGYLPALRHVEGLELVAVADRDPGRRRRLARLAGGLPAHESLAVLLDAEAVDALVIATPAAAHLADARLAAARGVPTLVEKPPAPDASEAAELASLEPMPAIGFNRRFDPGVAHVGEAIAGAPAVRLRLELRYRRSSWGAHEAADDALLDLGPHLIDLARWLTGSAPLEVRCRSAGQARARFELVLERGHAEVDCATDRPWREVVEARDEDGGTIARHHAGGLAALTARARARLPGGAPNGAGDGHPLVASLARELGAFAVAADGGALAPALATARDGAATMVVVEAVRRSAGRDGRSERVAA